MNFARDVVEAAPPDHRALVELARDGSRREWSFGEVADHSARLAGSLQSRHGVGRGDVVMTLIGSRPEWVLTHDRLLSPRRGGARLQRAAARPRPGPAPRRGAPQADRRRRAQPRRAVGRPTRLPGPDRSRRRAVGRRTGPGRRARARRPLPDHLHQRDDRRCERRRSWPALPAGPAPAGRALARRPDRRARLVHRRHRLVEVRAQRVHRPVAPGRRCTAARRALRPGAAARAAQHRAGQRALHGPYRVPRDGQAGGAASGAGAALARGRRRGAEPRRDPRLPRGHGARRSATATARPRPAS